MMVLAVTESSTFVMVPSMETAARLQVTAAAQSIIARTTLGGRFSSLQSLFPRLLISLLV